MTNTENQCKELFVYGTLRHGQSRHYILENYSFKLAILKGYTKIDLENLGFPIIIQKPSAEVEGELYFNLDEDIFKYLDQIEAVGHLYDRILVKVQAMDGNEYLANVYYPTKSFLKSIIKSENLPL
ncbi:MAG: gamma-glutamylcyclotransferase family protein [Promethearchaeota archaeon]